MFQSTDVLILGSGIAGLATALRLANSGLKIQIHAKSFLSDTATAWAQGGIASVFEESDSFELHVQDTLAAGAGLCHEEIVRIVVEEGPKSVEWLIDRGVEFTQRSGGGGFDLHREGGHSRPRIFHTKDLTGQEIQRALVAKLRELPNVVVVEHSTAVDLLENEGKVVGCAFLEKDGRTSYVFSRATVLATGGAAKIYRYCTNPEICSGDGIAMAARLGITIANMEFMQFHPTCLYDAKTKNFLITEAIRGEGAYLLNHDGKRFIDHPMGELASRDIVAGAIDAEIKRSGYPFVYLDARHLGPQVDGKFPGIAERLLSLGLKLSRDLIPVVPAAHYTCGGVKVDAYGRTEMPGLYAVGEVAFTGLHGANRLASNSLLEAAVFSARIAATIPQELIDVPRLACRFVNHPTSPGDRVFISYFWNEIQTVMWNGVGIRREEKRLTWAHFRLLQIESEIQGILRNNLWDRDVVELRNLLLVGLMMTESAKRRKESRGLHLREDFPHMEPNFAHDSLSRIRELPKNIAFIRDPEQLTRKTVIVCS